MTFYNSKILEAERDDAFCWCGRIDNYFTTGATSIIIGL